MGYLTSLKNLITTELDIVSTGIISGWLNSAANKCFQPAHDLWGGRTVTVLFNLNKLPTRISEFPIPIKQEKGWMVIILAYKVGRFFLACIATPFGLLFRFISMMNSDVRSALSGKFLKAKKVVPPLKRPPSPENIKNPSKSVQALTLTSLHHLTLTLTSHHQKESDKSSYLDLAILNSKATLFKSSTRSSVDTNQPIIEDCDDTAEPDPLSQTLSQLLTFDKTDEYFRYLFDHRDDPAIKQLIEDHTCQGMNVQRDAHHIKLLLALLKQFHTHHNKHCDLQFINSQWNELMAAASSATDDAEFRAFVDKTIGVYDRMGEAIAEAMQTASAFFIEILQTIPENLKKKIQNDELKFKRMILSMTVPVFEFLNPAVVAQIEIAKIFMPGPSNKDFLTDLANGQNAANLYPRVMKHLKNAELTQYVPSNENIKKFAEKTKAAMASRMFALLSSGGYPAHPQTNGANNIPIHSGPPTFDEAYFQRQVNLFKSLSLKERQQYIAELRVDFQWLQEQELQLKSQMNSQQLNPSEQEEAPFKLNNISNTILFTQRFLKEIESFSPEQSPLDDILDEVDDLTSLDDPMERPQPRPSSDENTGKQIEPPLLTPEEELTFGKENFNNCVELAKTMSPEDRSEIISNASKALGDEKKALDELKDKLSSSTLSPAETAELNKRFNLSQRKVSHYNRLVEELQKISQDALLDDVFDEFKTTSTLESSAPNLNSVAAQGVEGAAHLGSVDGSTEAGNDGDGKPLSKSIEGGVENAVLQSNPNEHNVGGLAAAEISG